MDGYLAVTWHNSSCTVHSRLPIIQKVQGEILVSGERDWELHKIQKYNFLLIFTTSLILRSCVLLVSLMCMLH